MHTSTELVTPATEKIVREIGIPPSPVVLVEFTREMARSEPDVLRLSHLISKDAGLSSAILKTVNSPLYALSSKASSIRSAMTVLGLRGTANLLSSLLLRRAFASLDGVAMRRFWESSSTLGLMIAYLGRELGVADVNDAHTFGLFRDCGIPPLLGRFPDYGELLDRAEEHDETDPTPEERVRYGADHAEVGAMLAASWSLPDSVCAPIRLHHWTGKPVDDPALSNRTTQKLIAIGALAECLYRTNRGTSSMEIRQRSKQFAFDSLGIDEQQLEPLQSDLTRFLAGC